jgi:hypothetical protein
MPDALEDIKRQQEVADRPKMTIPKPPGLQNEFSNAPYSLAAEGHRRTGSAPTVKQKSEMEKSLEWNKQQQKVAEGQ